MLMMNSWGNTKAVLEDLEKLLYCGICGQLAEEPSTLGGCEHYFCRSCIEDVEANCCPNCDLPFHTKDIQINRQLATAVSLCYQLDNLLHLDADRSFCDVSGRKKFEQGAPEEAHRRERPGASKESSEAARKLLPVRAHVCDLTAGASSPSPPSIHRRTRSAIKKKEKNEFLTQTNVRWAIGQPNKDVDKCSSCSRSDSKRVSFRQRSVSASCDSNSGAIGDVKRVVRKIEEAPAPAAPAKQAKTKVKQTKGRARVKHRPEPCPTTSERLADGTTEAEAKTEVRLHSEQTSKETTEMRDRIQTPWSNVITTLTPQDTADSNLKLGRNLAESVPATLKRRCAGEPSSTFPRPQLGGKKGRTSPKASPTSALVSPISTLVSPNSKLVSPAHTKRNTKGETLLHVAVIKGDLNKVKSLLEKGAEVNTRDHAGWTPLHEACNHGYREIAEMLLDHGALINVPGHENETPLHDAINNNRLDCVSMLVSRGANLLIRNLHGKTVFDLATTQEMRKALNSSPVQEKVAKTVTHTSSDLEYRPLVFLTSMLSREQQNRVQACARLLNGKVVQTFTNEVSHLISSVNSEGMCPRSLKYMEAVLRGTWVVNMDWVETCLEYGKQISEEPFEVPGSSTNPNSQAPSKGRMNKIQQMPGLFDGCHFYFKGKFGCPLPKLSEIHRLIEVGSGTILKREPRLETICQSHFTIPYHARQDSQLANCSFYIIYAKNEVEGCLEGGCLYRASAKWLMNCIAYFELGDPADRV